MRNNALGFPKPNQIRKPTLRNQSPRMTNGTSANIRTDSMVACHGAIAVSFHLSLSANRCYVSWSMPQEKLAFYHSPFSTGEGESSLL